MMTVKAFSLLSVVALSATSLAQEITIRVVNEKNGRPLSNRETSLNLIYEKDEPTPARYDSTMLANTDIVGEAHFHLPEPAPNHFGAYATLNQEEHWVCWCSQVVATTDVLQRGIVAAPPRVLRKSPRVRSDLTTRPGEIVFHAYQQSWFERFWHTILAPLERE